MKQHVIKLTDEERTSLAKMTTSGRHAVREVQRAKVILESDAGLIDKEIAQKIGVSLRTVERIRKHCVLEGVDTAVKTRKYPPRRRKIDGEAEARLVQLACSDPPKGLRRWTLGLLTQRIVELQIADQISIKTVRRVLKKRVETMASTKVLHSTSRKRSVRPRDGGCARGLSSTL